MCYVAEFEVFLSRGLGSSDLVIDGCEVEETRGESPVSEDGEDCNIDEVAGFSLLQFLQRISLVASHKGTRE